MDFLLKNGKIYDGTGADAFLGDILVRGNRIEKIGEELICDGAHDNLSASSLRCTSTVSSLSSSNWRIIKFSIASARFLISDYPINLDVLFYTYYI